VASAGQARGSPARSAGDAQRMKATGHDAQPADLVGSAAGTPHTPWPGYQLLDRYCGHRAGDPSRGTVALVDRGWQQTGSVTALRTASVFAGFRFPPDVISVAVRWYLRYGLSYRDVEELLAERGVTVDHVGVYRWVQRFTPEFIEAARPGRPAPGDRWFADETYLKVAGTWAYLYRAVDQHGQVIDVLLLARRDLAAARRFFTQALRAGPPTPLPTSRASRLRVGPSLAASSTNTSGPHKSPAQRR
jgi:DDE superfamily endonuclease